MKHFSTVSRSIGFKVLADGRSSQAALMVLRPGEATGERPEDEHPRCEQWLVVLSGTGRATVGRRRLKLKAGSLLLVEKGEAHQVVNAGRSPLVTLNFYAPAAYTRDGEVRPRAKRPPSTARKT